MELVVVYKGGRARTAQIVCRLDLVISANLSVPAVTMVRASMDFLATELATVCPATTRFITARIVCPIIMVRAASAVSAF